MDYRQKLNDLLLTLIVVLTAGLFSLIVFSTPSASASSPIPLASGLSSPVHLAFDGEFLYFSEESPTSLSSNNLKKISKQGGSVATLANNMALYEGQYRGIGKITLDNANVYAGYGGYGGYRIIRVPKTGGETTVIASTTGGDLIGVIGSDAYEIYYGSGFYYIVKRSLINGSQTTVVSGKWSRSSTADDRSLYFVDQPSKDLLKYDTQTGDLTSLISGNYPYEGHVFLDDDSAYLSVDGIIKKVSKQGGSVQTVVSSGLAYGYLSDNRHIYYLENGDLKRTPVSGGSSEAVVSNISITPERQYALAADEEYLYWTDAQSGTIFKHSKNINQPPVLSAFNQSKSDQTTQIQENGITQESTVVFKAALQDQDSDQVKLQVELKEKDQNFNEQDIIESGFVASGSEAAITRNGLVSASYKWRARVVDSRGEISEWQEFGTAGNIDFTIGRTIKVAVILAEPSDKSFDPTHNKSYFEQNIIPDVKDYYCEVSFGTRGQDGICRDGLVNLEFEVFDNGGVPYKLDKTQEYYGKEAARDFDGDGLPDATFDNTGEFTEEALLVADSAVSYNNYDAVAVIHQGDYCAGNECLYNVYFLEDITIGGSQEMAQNIISIAENSFLGSWAHELGHAMGKMFRNRALCDLYRAASGVCDYKGAHIDYWDLMSEGSRLGNPPGISPSHLSTFSKFKLNWLDFESINYGTHSVESLETLDVGQKPKIFNIAPNAYYIFEGRTTNSQHSRWDVAIKEPNKSDVLLVYKVNSVDPELTVINKIAALDFNDNSLVDLPGNLKVKFEDILSLSKNLSFNFQLSSFNPTLASGFILRPENALLKESTNFLPYYAEEPMSDGVKIFFEQTLYKKGFAISGYVINKYNEVIWINEYLENGRIAVQRKQADGSWEYVHKDAAKDWPEGAPEDIRGTFLRMQPKEQQLISIADADTLGPGTYRLALGYAFNNEPHIGLWPDGKEIGSGIFAADRSKLHIVYSEEFKVVFDDDKAPLIIATSTNASPFYQSSFLYLLDVVRENYHIIFLPVLAIALIFLIIARFRRPASDRRFVMALNILILISSLLFILILFFASLFRSVPEIIEPRSTASIRPFLKEPLPGNEEFSLDLDLHAITLDGKHTGMNYETGEYENQIPGAIASGDLVYDDEWIFVPEGTQVKYYASSHDIQQFLEQNPDIVQQLPSTQETYALSAIYYDANSQKYESTPLENQPINPGENIVYETTGTTDIQVTSGIVDGQGPIISHTQLNSEYLLNSPPITFNLSAADEGVGVKEITAKLDGNPISNGQTISFAQPGTHTIQITAKDHLGNISTETITYNVVYQFSGYLPPIKSDGTGIYKLGRTLPVKFQLTDANNQYISTANAQLFVAKISDGIAGTDEIPLSTSSADTGNIFRYDTTENQYIYNLSTDTLSIGSWQLKAALDDGRYYVVVISVR